MQCPACGSEEVQLISLDKQKKPIYLCVCQDCHICFRAEEEKDA